VDRVVDRPWAQLLVWEHLGKETKVVSDWRLVEEGVSAAAEAEQELSGELPLTQYPWPMVEMVLSGQQEAVFIMLEAVEVVGTV
jgi:hypothetical protein